MPPQVWFDWKAPSVTALYSNRAAAPGSLQFTGRQASGWWAMFRYKGALPNCLFVLIECDGTRGLAAVTIGEGGGRNRIPAS